ncbi:MAG: dual specificity protein phosphatase [Cyanobium sp.]
MLLPSWVLRGELAVGPAPLVDEHLHQLEREGLVAVLSLCSEEEATPPACLAERFHWRRCVLPDHKSCRPPELAELQRAVTLLEELAPLGPVYVHCQAGVERSPLVCMAWLMRRRHLRLIDALDYLKRVHPPTGPLAEQLACLRAWQLAQVC